MCNYTLYVLSNNKTDNKNFTQYLVHNLNNCEISNYTEIVLPKMFLIYIVYVKNNHKKHLFLQNSKLLTFYVKNNKAEHKWQEQVKKR